MNYGALGTLFPRGLSKVQREGIDIILKEARGLPVSHVAYLLATAYHETGFTMQPVREAFGKSDQDAVNKLERAWKAGQLKWVRTPYWRFDDGGKSWFGRGYVQLTHRTNYAKASKKLGVDMLGDPSKALDPKIAAKVLVRGSVEGWFTGKKLSDYLPGDYIGARRIINGTDRARDISRYAEVFEAALKATPVQPVTFFAKLVQFLLGMFGKK